MSTPATSANPEIETLIRRVIVYPAGGGDALVTPMVFSEAGACHPSAFYSRVVDLRDTFGDEVRKTRVQVVTVRDGIEPRTSQYAMYFNLSPQLPLNRSVARVVALNPERPGPRLVWRGDVVVVKLLRGFSGQTLGVAPVMGYGNTKVADIPNIDTVLREMLGSDTLGDELADDEDFV